MVHDCIKIIKWLVYFPNPGQVIAGDQPIYPLQKKVQRMYPTHYNGIMSTMGSLYIDMAFLSAIEDWLEVFG